ncbi:hypothetical protein PENTCL1PPCAC_10943, partial [Pristionchus entomophagus]
DMNAQAVPSPQTSLETHLLRPTQTVFLSSSKPNHGELQNISTDKVSNKNSNEDSTKSADGQSKAQLISREQGATKDGQGAEVVQRERSTDDIMQKNPAKVKAQGLAQEARNRGLQIDSSVVSVKDLKKQIAERDEKINCLEKLNEDIMVNSVEIVVKFEETENLLNEEIKENNKEIGRLNFLVNVNLEEKERIEVADVIKMEKKIMNLQNQNKTLTARNQELQRKLERKHNRKEMYKGKLERSEKIVDLHGETIRLQRDDIAKKSYEIERLSEENLAKQMVEHKNELSARDDTIDRLKKYGEDYEKYADQEIDRLKELEEDHKKYTDQLHKHVENKEGDMKILIELHGSEAVVLKTQIADKDVEIERLKEEINNEKQKTKLAANTSPNSSGTKNYNDGSILEAPIQQPIRTICLPNNFVRRWSGMALIDSSVSLVQAFRGPAARSGIKQGDQIISVDGVNVQGAHSYRIAELIWEAKEDTIELEVRQNLDLISSFKGKVQKYV